MNSHETPRNSNIEFPPSPRKHLQSACPHAAPSIPNFHFSISNFQSNPSFNPDLSKQLISKQPADHHAPQTSPAPAESTHSFTYPSFRTGAANPLNFSHPANPTSPAFPDGHLFFNHQRPVFPTQNNFFHLLQTIDPRTCPRPNTCRQDPTLCTCTRPFALPKQFQQL